MSNSNDFLQDYLDSLLNDNALGGAHNVADAQTRIEDNPLKLASGSNIAPLPSVSRAARVVPARPYAEPIRTLNLRMPLPPVAEPVIEEKLATEAQTDTETQLDTQTQLDTEAQFDTETKAAAEIKAEVKPALDTKPVIEATPVVETQPVVEAKVVVEAKPLVETQIESETVDRTAQAQHAADLSTMAPPAAWMPNGRPQWAQQPFECLIFKAGGLQLAAPLVELGSIYPLEENALTEIFGQTQWFMGLLPIKEYNIRTMDTGLVVMPERYNAAMRAQYRYVVSLFGSDWGLAVDAVVGTTLLDPDGVRWRGERSKRPWLAGTLIDQMCALFDISQLAWLFHNQDRKRSKR